MAPALLKKKEKAHTPIAQPSPSWAWALVNLWTSKSTFNFKSHMRWLHSESCTTSTSSQKQKNVENQACLWNILSILQHFQFWFRLFTVQYFYWDWDWDLGFQIETSSPVWDSWYRVKRDDWQFKRLLQFHRQHAKIKSGFFLPVCTIYPRRCCITLPQCNGNCSSRGEGRSVH